MAVPMVPVLTVFAEKLFLHYCDWNGTRRCRTPSVLHTLVTSLGSLRHSRRESVTRRSRFQKHSSRVTESARIRRDIAYHNAPTSYNCALPDGYSLRDRAAQTDPCILADSDRF